MKRLKVIHLLIFIILFILLIFGFSSFTKFLEDKKNYEPYSKVESTNNKIIINGDYLTYINIGDSYEELGAKVYDENGNERSSNILTTYYKNDERVFSVDTRFTGDYVVKYEFGNIVATRVIIICDRDAPKFRPIETKTITNLEATTYDVNEGVTATDNSGKVEVECDNSLGTLPGNYTINCKAIDPYGNISTKKRLIKVIDGIQFNDKENLEIVFPEDSNYIYKYSLDNGQTFIECGQREMLTITDGSVIAAVYLDDELIMTNTYLK